MGDTAGGGTQVIVNFDSINNKLDELINSLSIDSKKIIRDCALTLYTNTNFDITDKSPIVIANECINRALVFAKELQNKNLLD